MSKEKKDKRKYDDLYHDKQDKEVKKAQKKVEKVAKLLGYSNDTNPFGDPNLLQPFVWGKKKDKEKKDGIQIDESDEHRLSVMHEIERVRKRRAEREKELEEMERLRTEEQRLREAAQYGDWQKKEDEFHMEQTKVRSQIRLIERREKPIDALAKNILQIEAAQDEDVVEKDLAVKLAKLKAEFRNPLEILKDVDPSNLRELLEDVSSYLHLEIHKSGAYQEFWEALREVVAAELNKHTSKSSSSLHKAVAQDASSLLGNKTKEELMRLEQDITRDVAKGVRSDVEYWEEMLKEIRLERCRLLLTETHSALLSKQEQIIQKWRQDILAQDSRIGDTRNPHQGSTGDNDGEEANRDKTGDALEMYLSEQQQELEPEEERMPARDEVSLPTKTYWWEDKYRPRKPRYFNRVRTGYDWNKYNQTHYDHDNPPPKSIQGYKFNIFYPDLIDKTKTPKYFVEPADDPEFVILRFHAGPPYEDVAFKVINREWDIGRKTGFKCIFERGILQFHFNFKKHRYRR